ncbi:MAG: ABC transporter substrate-binding protein [Paludibacteraceae bacterium]
MSKRKTHCILGFFSLCVAVCSSGCTSTRDDCTRSEQAQYFRLCDTLGVRMAEVFSPWEKGILLARYYLVADTAVPTPTDGIRLHVPLRRIATTSATHIGFLSALDKTDIVVAMATPHLVYNRPTQPVADLGEDINLRIEPLLLAYPEAVFISSYGQEVQTAEHIRKAGIPIVYLTEWMEQNPLARMEWIRFVGALTGTEEQADSIAAAVRAAYHNEQAQADKLAVRRSIMSGASFRGTWYVPSGSTYMGRLFRDAGAEYAYSERNTEGSIPLSMEQALQSFGDADVWVGVNARTLQELRALDERQTWFKAYQTGEVYNFYRRETKNGANDFWELGVVHPELILRDLRYALYPETLPNYSPIFLQRLKQD